ncbi:hypothetical protein AAHC03_013124 [Spirometra sp. Aus1]
MRRYLEPLSPVAHLKCADCAARRPQRATVTFTTSGSLLPSRWRPPSRPPPTFDEFPGWLLGLGLGLGENPYASTALRKQHRPISARDDLGSRAGARSVQPTHPRLQGVLVAATEKSPPVEPNA